jgi:SAM-dependent methyltransferase
MAHETEIIRAYDSIAPYYETMVGERGHFERQIMALAESRLISNEGVRCLDAACGPGQGLAGISRAFDWDVIGADGSPGMIRCATANPNHEGIPFARCRWSKILQLFSATGRFDTVLFMGNAIAHVRDREDLARLLTDVLEGLRPGGRIVFDARHWEPGVQDENDLVEPGRLIGQERYLVSSAAGTQSVDISDECRYRDGVQEIKYIFRSAARSGEGAESVTLSYLPFTEDDALRALSGAGFVEPRFIDQRPSYPYVLFLAAKSENA